MVVMFLQFSTKLTLLDQLLNIRKGAHSSRIPFYSGMSCLSRYSPCHQQLVLITCARKVQALAARGRDLPSPAKCANALFGADMAPIMAGRDFRLAAYPQEANSPPAESASPSP